MPTNPLGQATRRASTIGGGESLVDITSRTVNGGYGQVRAVGNELANFVRAQPISVALIALGVGYLLGRLRA